MKKWQLYLLIALLVPLSFFVHLYPLRDFFAYEQTLNAAEQELADVPAQMESIVQSQGNDFLHFAQEILSVKEEYDASLYFYTTSTKYWGPRFEASPSTLNDKVKQMETELGSIVSQTGIPFTRVFYHDNTYFYYPQGSCVFRYHVMLEEDIYYQIDLIYSQNWEQHKQNKLIHDPFGNDLAREVAENWCIVVLRVQ